MSNHETAPKTLAPRLAAENIAKFHAAAIEATGPPGTAAGTRYNAYLMGQLDSEKAA